MKLVLRCEGEPNKTLRGTCSGMIASYCGGTNITK